MLELLALLIALILAWFGSLFPPQEPAAKVDVTNYQAVREYDWTLLDPPLYTQVKSQSALCHSTFLSPSGKGYSKPIGIGAWSGYAVDSEGDPEGYFNAPVSFLGNGTMTSSPVHLNDFCSVAKDTGDQTLIYTSGYSYSDSYVQGINIYSGTKKDWGGPLTKAGLADGKTIHVVPDIRPTEIGQSASWHAGNPWDTDDVVVCYFVVGRTLEVSFADEGNTSDQMFRISFTDWKNPSLGGTITRIQEVDDIIKHFPSSERR